MNIEYIRDSLNKALKQFEIIKDVTYNDLLLAFNDIDKFVSLIEIEHIKKDEETNYKQALWDHYEINTKEYIRDWNEEDET